jgi:hypothetical protein
MSTSERTEFEITLRRTGNVVEHQHKGSVDHGEISTLSVLGMKDQYWALERRGGYLALKPGSYNIVMEYSPQHKEHKDPKQPRRQFRVTNHHQYSKAHKRPALILIHAANHPFELLGCIAPGKQKTADGVLDSGDALNEIFEHFGGFEVGKQARLIVSGPASG